MSTKQEKNVLLFDSKNDDDFTKNHKNQLVLQIPSAENECELPTILTCTTTDGVSGEYDLSTVTLDDMLKQVKESYLNDPEALQRFSYYLVLKAKEISE